MEALAVSAWRIAHAPSVRRGRWKVIGNDRQTQPPSQPTIDGDRELDFDAWPTIHPLDIQTLNGTEHTTFQEW